MRKYCIGKIKIYSISQGEDAWTKVLVSVDHIQFSRDNNLGPLGFIGYIHHYYLSGKWLFAQPGRITDMSQEYDSVEELVSSEGTEDMEYLVGYI